MKFACTLRLDIPPKRSEILKSKWMNLQKGKLLVAVFNELCVKRDGKASLQIRQTTIQIHFFIKLPWQYLKIVSSLQSINLTLLKPKKVEYRVNAETVKILIA